MIPIVLLLSAAAGQRSAMKIVAWNIQQGGRSRKARILGALREWSADVVFLSEFRGTPASTELAQRLSDEGYGHQLTTVSPVSPGVNALLIASRSPLALLPPPDICVPRLFLAARVEDHSTTVIGIAVPGDQRPLKWEFHRQILEYLQAWNGEPAMLIGDTNTGEPGLDEAAPFFNRREGDWMTNLRNAQWKDAWRHQSGDERAYTWHHPGSKNGFRIDQAFLNPSMLKRLTSVKHDWARDPDGTAPSDHAALIVDFDH